MPAAGPDLPLRPRQHPHDAAETHPHQAGADLAADQARPRALHPLLPLHAVQRGRVRRPAAGDGASRRELDHHHLRGPAVRRRVLRQRHRAVPGGRAHLHVLPVPRPAVGDPEHPDGVRRVPDRLQHVRDHPRGPGGAGAVAQQPGGRRRLALRQGPLHVPQPGVRAAHHHAPDPRRPRLGAGGRLHGARPRRRPAAGGGRAVRPRLGGDHRLRRPDQRGGAPVGAHPGAGTRRRPDRVRPGGRRRLGRAGRALGHDRRPGRRRPDRRRRSHRPGAPRADPGAAHPSRRRARRARRHDRRRRNTAGHAARSRARLGRAGHHPRGAAGRVPGRGAEGPQRPLGDPLERSHERAGGNGAGPRRAHQRLPRAAHSAGRERARLPGRRPGNAHAGRGTGGGRAGAA